MREPRDPRNFETSPAAPRSTTGTAAQKEPSSPTSGAAKEDKKSPFLDRAQMSPAIELPKGGGSVRGMGEKFTPSAFTGAGAFAVLKGQGRALLFAAFIGYTALQMLLDKKPRPGRQLPGPWGQAGNPTSE